jgi:hypothetical protein
MPTTGGDDAMWTRRLPAVLATLLAMALAVPGRCSATIPDDFDRSDSTFAAEETHSVVTVDEGARKGWAEHTDTVRCGACGLSVVQRLDPATGLPAPAQQWGDAFIGIAGHKPASYMASNWSPWDFLAASVRLKGDTNNLPQPTKLGLLVYCGLAEVTNKRIVAEAIWQDSAGGALRVRLVGWRGVQRFGLSGRYLKPDGREVESITYALTCQPYDYSDRGYWERRRFLLTPTGDQPLPDKPPLQFDPAQVWQFVFHNRFAQSDSGTVLALDRQSVRSVAVAGAGNTIGVTLAPADPAGELVAVLGDWVDEAYPLAAARFFAEERAVTAELAEVAGLPIAFPPTGAVGEDREVDALLHDYPELATDFAARVNAARAAAQAARERITGAAGQKTPPPPRALVEYATAASELDRLYRDIRAGWVTRGLWAP